MSYTELSFLVGTQTNYVKSTSSSEINTSNDYRIPDVVGDYTNEEYVSFNIFKTVGGKLTDEVNDEYNNPQYLDILDMEAPIDGAIQNTSGNGKEITSANFTDFRYTYTLNATDSHNYLKGNVSAMYDKNINPYAKLIEDFNGKNNQSKRLKASDFIYLRDIGVYPINRLMILRRFQGPPDYDLTSHKKKILGQPISTVIGWVKNDEDIFNMSFNEVWKNQSKWLHELVSEIISAQFGMDISNIFPIPGWGQSFVFSFLNKMGITNYGGHNLPIGDANLLRDGITRETTSTGLASNITLKLETCYEIKYINGIDPTITFHNIINNLLAMGTSNINFLFKPGGTVGLLGQFMDDPTTTNLLALMNDMIDKIFEVVQSEINNIKTKISSVVSGVDDKIKSSTAQQQKANNISANQKALIAIVEKKDTSHKKNANDDIEYDDNGEHIFLSKESIDAGTEYLKGNKNLNNKEYQQAKEAEKKEQNDNSVKKAGGQIKLSESETAIRNTSIKLNAATEIVKFTDSMVGYVLSSTMARYKWPVRGAIAQATGVNITPWHLTIGNPEAPIISMNQIKVDNVDVRLGSEMLFNDLPKYIYATITISNARPLGKQELMRFFGVNFKRNYSIGHTEPRKIINEDAFNAFDKDNAAKDAVNRSNS